MSCRASSRLTIMRTIVSYRPAFSGEAHFAKRIHDCTQAVSFIARFGMMNLAEDQGASVRQSPHVAGSEFSCACNIG